jgi:hypothetical protein
MAEIEAASKSRNYHEFHASAHLLEGELSHPVNRIISPHSQVSLKTTRGGHQALAAQNINIDGLIHLKEGHTRVSGGGTLKHKGYITLATSVLEGLNVFEVVEADRVVSQVSTEHAYAHGHMPSVTFLGSHFNNLKINGFPVTLTLDLGICGKKPSEDKSYLAEAPFLRAAQDQMEKVAKADGLPKELKSEYAEKLAVIDKLVKGDTDPRLKVTCSLVKSIDNVKSIPVPGIRAIGHILVIPEFGWVALGEIEVSAEPYEDPITRETFVSNCFTLNMLCMRLGCIGGGRVNGGGAACNGHTYP